MEVSNEVSVELSVVAETDSGEVVGVVGSIPSLGSWMPSSMLALNPKEKTEDGKQIWSTTVQLPTEENIQYRFLKAYIKADEDGHSANTNSTNGGTKRDVMVTSWECHIAPRSLNTSGTIEKPALALFGKNGGVDNVDRGWLTTQTEVQLRLHNNPVSMWKGRFRHQIYRVKCTPIDLRHGEVLPSQAVTHSIDDESNHDIPVVQNAPPISVSVLRDSLITPHEQPVFGTPYKEDDYMLFRSQTFYPKTQGYQFDIFICHPTMNDADTPKHVGTAYLLPMNLDHLTGCKSIPIVGLKQKPIGHLVVDYLIVNPLDEEFCDMSVSYSRYWPSKRPVDVGHRGLGATYCYGKKANNTSPKRGWKVIGIISYARLTLIQGAQYVEFDVQLSKDKVPVIYHDLVVGLSLKKKGNSGAEHFEIPIKDLRAEQLHKLKVNHLAVPANSQSDESIESLGSAADNLDDRPFPTLQECLERVNTGVGFNIEVKYCMPLQDGTNEQGLEHFAERNAYLDVILKDVMKHAKDRKIIFSCFDPDVCTMLRLKQNRFPVLFLCSDVCEAWPVYRDSRTWEVTRCAAFCASEQLLGVNVATDNFLNRPELVEVIRKLGLVSFCWGWNEETNSKQSVARVKQLGVDGVIYDKIHEMNLRQEDDFLVEGDMLATSIIKSNGSAENVEMSIADTQRKSRAELAATTSGSSNQASSALSFAGKIQNGLKQET